MVSEVILVHGLWNSGFQLGVLKHRLEADRGFAVAPFSYPSLSGSMADHARSLIDFAQARGVDELHFVGHSLGGLVILRALQSTNDLPPGRVVLLGTPAQGSKTAQSVARLFPFGRAIIGAAGVEEMVECAPRTWSGRHEVGLIAGSMGLGIGRLVADLAADHDGTVMVEETRLPGAKDHIVLNISHTGMLFSADVVEQTGHFLRDGRFRR